MRRYISPNTEITHLFTEHSLLDTSTMPIGGTTDHFDTHRQDLWFSEWDDKVEQ